MKNRYIYGALLTTAMFFAGCEAVAPWEDDIPGIVSVAKTGLVEIESYSVGEEYNQDLKVVKAGMMDASTTVDFSVDASLLDSVNRVSGKDYKLLPTSCYQFAEHSVTLASGVRMTETSFIYSPEKIKQIDNNGAVVYALPLKARADGLPMNNSRNIVIYIFKILNPDIRMLQTSSESFLVPVDGNVPDIKTQVGVLFNNKWDINLTFTPDLQAVEDYNTANTSNYMLLPDKAYSLDPEAPVLKSGFKSTDIYIKLAKDKLAPGSYMLPLKLTGVSKFEIYPQANTATFFISYPGNKIDKKAWTITANTEEPTGEPTGGGRAIHMIDDNLNTYWHSQWQNGSHALPHILEIDMKKDINIGRIDLARRPNAGGTKFVNLEGSLDGKNWTLMGELTIIQKDGLTPYVVKPMTARYIRMTIPEIPGKQTGTVFYMTELDVYGLEK